MVQKRSSYAIQVKGLRKAYGKTSVLKGVDFSVKAGTILALLGPNGAGKTTIIRILSTLLEPDAGKVFVAGYDLKKEPFSIKHNIGLTGQYAAVDEYLNAEENLLMMGRLYRLSLEDTKKRTADLLELFDLVSAGKRTVKTYSGGMKRRLDLAMSLIASPPIIFLDEPTTGLDPRSRQTMWHMIKQLTASGTTILLTTQHMEEADQLADNIVVIDEGVVIAEGSSNKLKAKVGSDRLLIVIATKNGFEKATQTIQVKGMKADSDQRTLSIPSSGNTKKFRNILRELEAAKIEIEAFSLHRPTLDDVFLSLTGHAASQDETDETTKKGKT